jgi:Tol biopolymer transport system component
MSMMRGGNTAALAVLCACGRLEFGELGDAGAPAARTCWDQWTSGTIAMATPQRIAELVSTMPQGNPSLSSDGFTLYFDRSGALYASTRSALDAPWQPAVRLDAIDGGTSEGRMTVTAVDSLVVFASDRGTNTQLWTTRRSGDMQFDAPSQSFVTALLSSDNELDPELSADGLHLYYAPYDMTSNIQLIVVASRASTSDAFAGPTELPELQISTAIGDPSLSPDELVIAFSSGTTMADNDLYYATRADRASSFGTPLVIPGVNASGVSDNDVELSRDGCEIYFTSFRGGLSELYLARVP